MFNKDIVYILSFILIIINCIIYNKQKLPNYTNSIIFKLLFVSCLTIVLHYNIYIGFFLGITYVNIINN